MKNLKLLSNGHRDLNKMKTEWQSIVAIVLVLVGAILGGSFGGVIAGFAGDSWWKSDFVLNLYQYTIGFGGACLGAAPGMIWLLYLRHKWVLPFLCAAGCALLLPVLERMPLSNDPMALLYAGIVTSGLVMGFLLWWSYRRASTHTIPT